MPFSWDNMPYTNFHELNIDWFINKFKEIFDEWTELYNTMVSWKSDTETELDEWLRSAENDIEDWETGILSDLNDWKDNFESLFSETFDNLSQIKTDAENARDAAQGYATDASRYASAAEASATSVTESSTDIAATKSALLKTCKLHQSNYSLYVVNNNYYSFDSVTQKMVITSSKKYISTRYVNLTKSIIAFDFTAEGFEYAIRYFDETGTATTSGSTGYIGSSTYKTGLVLLPKEAKKFLFTFKRADGEAISSEDLTTITSNIYGYYASDESLTEQYVAADAKVTGNKLAQSLALNVDYAIEIPDETDYNTLTTPGSYVVKTNTSAASMTHNNNITLPHRLFVSTSTNSNRVFQFIVVNNQNVEIYKRFKYENWYSWRKIIDDNDLNNAIALASYSTDANSIKAGVLTKKSLTEFTSLKTIPAAGSNAYFVENDSYKGIPYSAAYKWERDVFYNCSIESIFSAFKNPYANIYNFDYETADLPGTRTGSTVWAGGVCSTYVSYATGRPLHLVVDEMERLLQFKDINGLEDLEVGDVLFQQGMHVALITGFRYSGFEIKAINVTEQWKPLFRTVWYTPSEFWTRYYDGGTKENPGPHPFKVGRFADDYTIKTIPELNIVDDIISERGDNAHFALGDDIWIYITDENTSITLTAPNGTSSTVTYTSLPQKTINGTAVPVYNFKNVLNSVGLWKLKGSSGTYASRVTIYSIPGDITAVQSIDGETATTTITVGTHSGCTLAGFMLLTLRSDDIGNYPAPADAQSRGFTRASGTTYQQFHDVVTESPFTIDTSPKINNSFYVRVYFETGCGLTYKDSNCIYSS